LESNEGNINQSLQINATHGRIMAAALELFATRGFHGTGIRDIAGKAGVSTANLYHYTGSKENLLFQLMQNALAKLLAAAKAITEQYPDPRAALEQLVRMHVITHALSPMASAVVDDQFGVLEGETRNSIIEQRDRYEKFYGSVIKNGVSQKLFSVPDESAARLGLLEMLSGVARWYSPAGKFGPVEVAEIHVLLSLSLLGADNKNPVTSNQPVLELVERIWGTKN